MQLYLKMKVSSRKIEAIQKLKRNGKKVLSDNSVEIETWRGEVAISIPLLALDGAGDADAAGSVAAEVQPPPAKNRRPSKRLRKKKSFPVIGKS